MGLIIHVACMAHVRRKFFNAAKYGRGFAKDSEKALAYIQKVYFLENRLREQKLSDEEFDAQRKLKILPVLNEFNSIAERSINPFVLGRKN